jgi:hypothetical protein
MFIITKINSSEKSIELNIPLHIGLDKVSSKNAKVVKMSRYKNIGLQDFTLERSKTSGSNFLFSGAFNVFVKRINSIETPKHHFVFTKSHNIIISESYLENAYNRGTGGNGYGFALEKLSTNILITNNIIKDVRHEVVLSLGVNSNVYSYNYHADTLQDTCLSNPSASICSRSGSSLRADNIYFEADIAIHGHMAHHNLFEGNIGHYFTNDHVHFRNGPGNTFFRNKIKGQPASLSWLPKVALYTFGAQDKTAFVGNFVLNNAYVKEEKKTTDSFFAGNAYEGVVYYSGSSKDPIVDEDSFNWSTNGFYPSLYLGNRLPNDWGDTMAFPAFGNDVSSPDMSTIPAEVRFKK